MKSLKLFCEIMLKYTRNTFYNTLPFEFNGKKAFDSHKTLQNTISFLSPSEIAVNTKIFFSGGLKRYAEID